MTTSFYFNSYLCQRFVRKSVIGIDYNFTLQAKDLEICKQTNCKIMPQDFTQWDPPLGCKCGIANDLFINWLAMSPILDMQSRAYPGAAREMYELSKPYKIWIITATCNPWVVEPWLKREGIVFDRIIFTESKLEVEEWEVLIDDSPTTLEKAHKAGRKALRKYIPWNGHLAHIPGFHRWENVGSLIQ
jgi:5'(3')-deoxyribonucleotidase